MTDQMFFVLLGCFVGFLFLLFMGISIAEAIDDCNPPQWLLDDDDEDDDGRGAE